MNFNLNDAYRVRVKLTVDLTKHDSRCVAGSEGWTGYSVSGWARQFDRFVGVYFDSGARLDVLWKSLERIDDGADLEPARS